MIELNIEEESRNLGASLKVIGIGGGGGNAVNSMIASGELDGVNFVVANTDAQALENSPAENKIQLGAKITRGLGAGSNPDVGRRAAEEDLETVTQHISNADILFLTAGLGGGTGSGGIPVIAQSAKESGVLSVAVVSKPFLFEGKKRMKQAEEAIESLRGFVDTLIVVPNQKLLEVADPKISMLDAFAMSNDILKQGIKGIADIITKPGHINVDFADVRSVMKDMGKAIMGTGRCSGEGRAKEAVLKAINSPLLESISIEGARGVLINITGNSDLGLHEIHEAVSVIYEMVSKDANIILGSVIDPNIDDEIMVTVIATGFGDKEKEEVFTSTKVHQVPSVEPVVEHREISEPKENEVTGCTLAEKFDLNDVDTPAFLRKKAQEEEDKITT
jgi:cell division protein FtsZ